MSEHPSQPQPERKNHEPNIYYISENGNLWSPMQEVGVARGANGEVIKYILGDPYNLEKTKEVPAAWFEAYRDTLQIKDGETWSMVGKPTLETAVAVETPSSAESAEQAEIPQEIREDLGRGALDAVGIDAPAERDNKSQEEAVMNELNQLREGLSDRDRLALHQYAAALYGHEETAARRKMSLELQGDTQRLRKARELYTKLSDLRASDR